MKTQNCHSPNIIAKSKAASKGVILHRRNRDIRPNYQFEFCVQICGVIIYYASVILKNIFSGQGKTVVEPGCFTDEVTRRITSWKNTLASRFPNFCYSIICRSREYGWLKINLNDILWKTKNDGEIFRIEFFNCLKTQKYIQFSCV